MGKSPAQKTNVQSMPQTQARVLPDLQALSALDQFKALLANMSPEERKQAQSLVTPPKRDVAKLLDIKTKIQDYASKLMVEAFNENLDGKEALGIIWKAAWPKKYYQVDEQGNRVRLANGAMSSWVPGGKANSKDKYAPWIATGHYQLVRIQLDEKGNQVEVVETNGDDDDTE